MNLRETLGATKQTATKTYQAGLALSLAQKQLLGKWHQWLSEHSIPKTTAWEAIQLYERCSSVDQIQDLTTTEAKIKFHIYQDAIIQSPGSGSSGISGSSGGGGGNGCSGGSGGCGGGGGGTSPLTETRTPAEQLNHSFHQISNACEALSQLTWESGLLYSEEANQILATCKQIQSGITKARTKIKPLKQSARTKKVLSSLDNL